MPRPQNPELRTRLIAAAIDLLDANGSDFSMRTLADSVGYTVTAVYRCFANREALLSAMQLELFDRLHLELSGFVASHDGDIAALIGTLAEQFLAWAITHPVRYSFMFIASDAEVLLTGEDRARAQAPLLMLSALLQQGMASGELRVQDPKMTAILLFSSIHGFASLYCAHRLEGLLEGSPQEAFSQWYGPWILSLKATV